MRRSLITILTFIILMGSVIPAAPLARDKNDSPFDTCISGFVGEVVSHCDMEEDDHFSRSPRGENITAAGLYLSPVYSLPESLTPVQENSPPPEPE